jgi:hypothetical protein
MGETGGMQTESPGEWHENTRRRSHGDAALGARDLSSPRRAVVAFRLLDLGERTRVTRDAPQHTEMIGH